MRIAAGLSAVVILAALPARAEEKLADGIAAQVGSEIVLVSEVLDLVAPTEKRLRAAGASEEEIAKLRADGLENLIEWRLIEKVVRQSELFATDAEIDSAIATIAGQNGLSLDQLRASVEHQGMPFDDYRAQIKREIERRKVIGAMVAPKVRVDEEEVRKLYDERYANQPEGGEQYHIRQILVVQGAESGRTHEEACEAVRAAVARIQAGEAFEKVAEDTSDVAPARGGDIGWLHSSALAPWMSQAVGGLEPGAMSGVIELPFGCSVLKVVERHEFTRVTYEEAKPKLQQQVYSRKLSEQLRAWLEEQRENTYIERRGHFADAATFKHAKGDPLAPDADVDPGP